MWSYFEYKICPKQAPTRDESLAGLQRKPYGNSTPSYYPRKVGSSLLGQRPTWGNAVGKRHLPFEYYSQPQAPDGDGRRGEEDGLLCWESREGTCGCHAPFYSAVMLGMLQCGSARWLHSMEISGVCGKYTVPSRHNLKGKKAGHFLLLCTIAKTEMQREAHSNLGFTVKKGGVVKEPR